MEENPYKAPVEVSTKANDDVPRWAVATMICLGLLVTMPGVLRVLAMLGAWVFGFAD